MPKAERRNPRVTKALLDWLDEIYPDRAPAGDESYEEILRMAGRISVVRRLKKEYERQKEV